MLTKQEREATIERIKSYGDSDLPFYKLLFGSRAPYAMQYTEYLKALKDRVIDLCDTSNMVELPLDKDGEVIKVGDTVYDKDGEKGWFDYERKKHGNLLIPKYLQALKAKHECIVGYLGAGYKFNYIPLQDCEKEFNAAIKHYKKLAWKKER